MRFELHFQQQIARRAAAHARGALAGQSDHLPGMHALRNANVKNACCQTHPALGVRLRHAQSDLPGSAVEGVIDIKQHLGVMIFALGAEVRVLRMEAAPASAAHAAEQFGEEVGKIRRLMGRIAMTGKLETGIPVWWRTKLLPGLVAATQLVVGGALLQVGEHRIGLVDILHVRFGVDFFGNIRMEFSRQLAKGFLDLFLCGFARDAKRLVVVLELHVWPS